MEYRAPSGIKLFSFFNSWLDSWMARQQKQPKSFHADQLTSHPASSTEPVTLSTFFRSPLIPQYSAPPIFCREAILLFPATEYKLPAHRKLLTAHNLPALDYKRIIERELELLISFKCECPRETERISREKADCQEISYMNCYGTFQERANADSSA
ncbi:MAG: hypothetical protein HGA81_10890 [Chlorobium limicola]|nr:hypothetical protein [Chlorobium limicola]